METKSDSCFFCHQSIQMYRPTSLEWVEVMAAFKYLIQAWFIVVYRCASRTRPMLRYYISWLFLSLGSQILSPSKNGGITPQRRPVWTTLLLPLGHDDQLIGIRLIVEILHQALKLSLCQTCVPRRGAANCNAPTPALRRPAA